MTLRHFRSFLSSKNLSFSYPFSIHFWSPFLDPPLDGHFGPSWPTKVPTETPQVDFGPILGTQDFHKRPLGRPRSAHKSLKSEVVRVMVDAPWRHGSDPCSKRSPKAIRIDLGPTWEPFRTPWKAIWNPFGTHWPPIWDYLGDIWAQFAFIKANIVIPRAT